MQLDSDVTTLKHGEKFIHALQAIGLCNRIGFNASRVPGSFRADQSGHFFHSTTYVCTFSWCTRIRSCHRMVRSRRTKSALPTSPTKQH